MILNTIVTYFTEVEVLLMFTLFTDIRERVINEVT